MQETQRGGFDLRVKKIPWRRKWQPTSVILPRKIPWTEEPSRLQSMGYKELDMTEQLNNHNYCLDIFYNYNHIHMYTHTHTHIHTHIYFPGSRSVLVAFLYTISFLSFTGNYFLILPSPSWPWHFLNSLGKFVKCTFLFFFKAIGFFFFEIIIYLVMPNLHCGMWNIPCSLWHTGSSSLTRDWTWVPCISSTET